MFGYSNPKAAYGDAVVETSVMTASPHKLILMLYDGALLSIATATQAMREKRIQDKGNAISKAIEIILNGLRVSLDIEAGGELAERLDALYDYMGRRLVYANATNSEAILEEVADLLRTLKEGWEAIGAEVDAPGK